MFIQFGRQENWVFFSFNRFLFFALLTFSMYLVELFNATRLSETSLGLISEEGFFSFLIMEIPDEVWRVVFPNYE